MKAEQNTATTTEDAAVVVDISGSTLIITINRPKARNAVNREVAEGIEAALIELDTRDDLLVGIITGAGGNFCAGMDLKAFVQGIRPATPDGGFAGFVENPPVKPLIAAVEGYALAGGFEITLACDLVVASSTAVFGLPETKRGLVAGAGGLFRLPRLIPERIALEYALTGDNLSAEQAASLGLVNRVTEPGQALTGALELSSEITANGPLAVAATKRVIAESVDWRQSEKFDRQRAIIDPVFASSDAQEGARAFTEKRSPRWTGS